jgi:hypothetical protein
VRYCSNLKKNWSKINKTGLLARSQRICAAKRGFVQKMKQKTTLLPNVLS